MAPGTCTPAVASNSPGGITRSCAPVGGAEAADHRVILLGQYEQVQYSRRPPGASRVTA